ncbi:uncharacterized protein LOC130517549 [Takifugu flavidus]|uniref:uncharacterized protein LOC130517549 n=1 Tax=Takifugu flavidus TaxID=433684 RepID=UPI0025444021|nr:uncharacterized protein LOC130517549 [Takifugu flavidus]
MVDGVEKLFLVDTGATWSALQHGTDPPLSSEQVPVRGVEGRRLYMQRTAPMNVRIGAQSFSHTFLYGPDCPVNLLGRDIFTLLGCNIDIAQGGGTVITFRNGESFHCSDKAAHTQTLLWLGTENPGDLHTADIYWGLLTGPVDNPLMAAFRTWGPLIREFWACSPPPDPPHVTLFYDKDNDLTYQEWFNSSLDGQNWVVSVSGIVLGPQGVAAPVHLTPEQLQHYKMGTDSAPHITLAVAMGRQAKALGPMVAEANTIKDWVSLELRDLWTSTSHPKLRFIKISCEIAVVLQHRQLQRHHGAEDSNDREAEVALTDLPPHMWVNHQADVGLVQTAPVTFQIDMTDPVFIPQYPIKTEAQPGIEDTVNGLLAAGVIYPTSSPWNTPILPVLKADGQSYRMAHDLRAINALVKESPQPVPNPATTLGPLTPEHQWFTVIDLANAFFCLPLHPKLQPIFAFTYRGQQYTYTPHHYGL